MMTGARILFTGVGVFWLLIGVLTAVLTDRGIGPPMVFLSERTDTALFGGPPDEILDSIPELRKFRHTAVRGALAGFLVAAGLLTAGVAWYGLEEPQTWVLALLTFVGLAVIPYWWIALAPYRNAGIRVSLADVPPFMWVPAMVMPIASVLGWISHLRI
jgi:hypothetical protein